MDLLQNSRSERIQNHGLGVLKNENNQKQRKFKNQNENQNEKQNVNQNENQNEKINLFQKKKVYKIQFYDLYGNFDKEADNVMRSLQFFTKKTNITFEKSRNQHADFHIVIGKEIIRNSTYVFSLMPQEEVMINNNGKFTNVCMVYLTSSAGNKVCEKHNMNVSFDEFPVYHLDFNTNRRIKFCPENDISIKNMIDIITNRNVSINENISLSQSGSIFNNENLKQNQSQHAMVEVEAFETKSLVLKFVNELYYKLFQKNPKDTLYIKKELIRSMFQNMKNKSFYLKKSLFDQLINMDNLLIFEDQTILSATVNINETNGSISISQKAMENYGSGFLEFYRSKKNTFNSTLLKKYIMALYYMENLKHRNQNIMKPSNIFKNNEFKINEFQNSYYLGFDLEYMIIQYLKKHSKNKKYILPFMIKYQENKYILYYVYIYQSKIVLYEIYNQEQDRKLVNKINDKVELYFKTVIEKSFLSKAPLKYVFSGLVRKKIDFKLTFLDENSITLLYSHLHLFYEILNPNIELKQILGNKATDEMVMFITLLLEL